MKGILRHIVLWLWCGLIGMQGGLVQASQASGHLYFAGAIMEGQVERFFGCDETVKRYYFLGSIAPDSLWITHLATTPSIQKSLRERYKIALPNELNHLPGSLEDVHQGRPVEMTLCLLKNAATTEEGAYALGWTTHFLVDTYVHHLVNQWGGYSSTTWDMSDPALLVHNRLEALEGRHVFARYGKQMPMRSFEEKDIQTSKSYLLKSVSDNYPVINSWQKKEQDALMKVAWKSEELMQNSTQWFHYQGSHTAGEVRRMKNLIGHFRPNLGRMLEFLPDLPRKAVYRNALQSGGFLQEWEISKTEILETSKEIMPLCLLYLWVHQHAGENQDQQAIAAAILGRVEGKLREMNPNNDLLKPRDFILRSQ